MSEPDPFQQTAQQPMESDFVGNFDQGGANNANKFDKKKILIIGGIAFVLFLVVVTVVLSLVQKPKKEQGKVEKTKTKDITPSSSDKEDKQVDVVKEDDKTIEKDDKKVIVKPDTEKSNPLRVVMKVGDEKIYQKDLYLIMQNNKSPDVKKAENQAKDFLIKQSIFLQEGEKKGFITLNSEVYNSPKKNFAKRAGMVKQVEEKFESQSETVKGSIVSIWFYNSDYAPLGYEKAKKLAYEKISALHKKVVSRQMTIKEVGEAIKNDSSLEQLDKIYKGNAINNFEANDKKGISWDKRLSEKVWNLKVGEVSEIVATVGLSQKENKEKEIAYMFGQIESRTNSSKKFNKNAWLLNNKNSYNIIEYD